MDLYKCKQFLKINSVDENAKDEIQQTSEQPITAPSNVSPFAEQQHFEKQIVSIAIRYVEKRTHHQERRR